MDETAVELQGFSSIGEQQGFACRSVLAGTLVETPRIVLSSSQGGRRSAESISIGPLSTTGSQFTTITETISYSDDATTADGEPSEPPCAWGPIRPKFCQRFRNPNVVLACLCLVAVVQGMVINGFISVVISTIERRFDLTSTETGLIASGYDVASVLCLLPISYFGGLAHKPRWIGAGVLLLSLGSFLFALPHFAADSYSYESRREQNVCRRSGSANASSQPRRYHGAMMEEVGAGMCEVLLQEDEPSVTRGLSSYKYVMLFAQLLHGIGATPIYTLAVTYLDENLKAKMTPMYVGTFYAMAIVGPALGYVLGGELLELYCDIGSVDLDKVTITADDPQWVGAWWIGFLLIGLIALFLSVPLCGFPKSLPGAAALRAERVSEAYSGSECAAAASPAFGLSFRDIPMSVKLLLTNPTFMSLNLAGACEGLLISGFTVFAPKFIESQFSTSAAWAAQLVGFATIPSGGGGMFIGGYLVKRLDLRCAGILKLCLVTSGTALVLTLSFLVRCPNVAFAGVNVDYVHKNETLLQSNLTSDCNKLCHCFKDRYEPVCGLENIMYFSPCFAGCTNSFVLDDKRVYYNCSCVAIPSLPPLHPTHTKPIMAFEGKCTSSCHLLSYFLPVFSLVIFFTFVTSMPALSVTLRCVPDKQRSFALGIQWILVRCLGTIPAPILFGTLIDKTCQSWQEEGCHGSQGACFIYDNWLMGSYLLGLVFCFKGLSFCFFTLALLLYRAPRSSPRAVAGDEGSSAGSMTQMLRVDPGSVTNSPRLCSGGKQTLHGNQHLLGNRNITSNCHPLEVAGR